MSSTKKTSKFWGRDKDQKRLTVLGMISAMDAGLEVTLQKLRELEIMDDTIVVFTSDVR